MRTLLGLFFAPMALIPGHSVGEVGLPDPIVCAHIGASYDSVGNSMDVQEKPRPSMYQKSMGYWMIAEGVRARIYWYSRAQGGARARDLAEQARYLLRLAGGPHRYDCLLIGLSGHFLSSPDAVTAVATKIARIAASYGIDVIAITYPPPDRITSPFREKAEQVTSVDRYLFERARYELLMQDAGARLIDVWYDMMVVEDGLHPDNDSAHRAAQRVVHYVRSIVVPRAREMGVHESGSPNFDGSNAIGSH